MNSPRAVAAVLAVVVAAAWVTVAVGPSAQGTHEISECYTPTPSPTPTPSSTPSPPPTAPPTPVPECLPEEGEVINGTRTVSFAIDATSSRRIRQVTVSLVSETSGVPDPSPVTLTCPVADTNDEPNTCEHAAGDAPTTGIYAFTWTPALTPYNGSYKLVIDSWSCATSLVTGEFACGSATNPEHPSSLERPKLKVDNPPAKPGAPRILVATETSVTLEWDEAPYPDVISYTIYRARTDRRTDEPDNDAFTALITTTVTSIRDEVATPGAYWYKVAVTRKSVVAKSGGISSEPSDSSGPGVAVAPEPTPVPADAPPPPEPNRLKPSVASRPPPVPDAPFSAVLPYDVPEGAPQAAGPDVPEEGSDPRGPVLPLAVGAFLVSASLALVRMPY